MTRLSNIKTAKELINTGLLRSEVGSSLLMIMTIFSLTATLIVSLYSLTLSNSNLELTSMTSLQTESEAENAIVIMNGLAQNQLNLEGDLTSAKLKAYIELELPKYVNSPYSVVSVNATVDGTKFLAPIPTGPFSGMQGTNRLVRLELELQKGTQANNIRATSDAMVSEVYPTQFSIFSFGKLWFADPTVGGVTNTGNFYSADDFMMVGKPMLISRVTSGKKFRGTPASWSATGYKIHIADTDQPTSASDYKDFPLTVKSGCIDCDGTGMDWVNYTEDRWNGQVADGQHGVKGLQYINKGVKFNISDWFDPIFPLEDPKISEMKFVLKADIRIINGVWYLKDPGDPTKFPGMAVWSDHPGSFTSWDEATFEGINPVGQEDISAGLPGSYKWPGNTRPGFYSYYEFNPMTKAFNATDAGGIVSYGNVFRTTVARPGNWIPGQYVGKFMCQGAATCTNCNVTNQIEKFDKALTCTSGAQPTIAANLLNSTRSGFKMAPWETWALGKSAASKIWPMNFDVKKLATSMKCPVGTHPGELGCFFGTGKFMGRDFNGVIYISNSWSTRDKKMRSPYMQADGEDTNRGATAGVYPGSNNDLAQVSGHAAQQRLLPFQLCSDSLAGSSYDAVVGSNRFVIPKCDDYKNHSILKARTNAVRVLNGDFDPLDFPAGLTIVSDHHVVVLGDMNPNSVSNKLDPSLPWTPLFIGGDSVTVLSNNWDDHNARWDVLASSLTRNTIDTVLNLGISTSPWSQLVHLNENWGVGTKWQKRGPMVGNTTSNVYKCLSYEMDPMATYSFTAATFLPPMPFPFTEDPHYQLQMYQPPGIDALKIFTPLRIDYSGSKSPIAKGGP